MDAAGGGTDNRSRGNGITAVAETELSLNHRSRGNAELQLISITDSLQHGTNCGDKKQHVASATAVSATAV